MDNKLKIILEVFKCICNKCSFKFDYYDFPDFLYGERLIRTKDGQDFALARCYKDNVFEEVGKINDEFFKEKSISESIKNEAFDKIYGYACDSINRKKLDASIGVICPNCKSSDVNRFEYDPIKKEELEVKLISYKKWNTLSNVEKKKLIFSKLQELGY